MTTVKRKGNGVKPKPKPRRPEPKAPPPTPPPLLDVVACSACQKGCAGPGYASYATSTGPVVLCSAACEHQWIIDRP